jgi:hypothetical protein
MSGKSSKTKRHIHPGMFLMIGLLLIVILGSLSYAKYVRADSGERAAIAYKFYFCSNLLGENEESRTYTYAPGTTEINFTVNNHPDGLRYSEIPVYYTIAVNEIDAVTGKTTDVSQSVKVEIRSADAVIDTNAVRDDQVTISGLAGGKSYFVTATGTSVPSGETGYPGYHKTLTAVFHIPEDEPVVYKSVDSTAGSYVLLTVWSQNYAGDVTITFPKGLLPDNTDAVMRNWTIDDKQDNYTCQDSESFISAGYNSHVYRFFIDANPAADNRFTADNFTASYNVRVNDETEIRSAETGSLE